MCRGGRHGRGQNTSNLRPCLQQTSVSGPTAGHTRAHSMGDRPISHLQGRTGTLLGGNALCQFTYHLPIVVITYYSDVVRWFRNEIVFRKLCFLNLRNTNFWKAFQDYFTIISNFNSIFPPYSHANRCFLQLYFRVELTVWLRYKDLM